MISAEGGGHRYKLRTVDVPQQSTFAYHRVSPGDELVSGFSAGEGEKRGNETSNSHVLFSLRHWPTAPSRNVTSCITASPGLARVTSATLMTSDPVLFLSYVSHARWFHQSRLDSAICNSLHALRPTFYGYSITRECVNGLPISEWFIQLPSGIKSEDTRKSLLSNEKRRKSVSCHCRAWKPVLVKTWWVGDYFNGQ